MRARLLHEGVGNKRLSAARRAVEENTLGRGDARGGPKFGKAEGELDKLLHEFDGLTAAADRVVPLSGHLAVDRRADNELRLGVKDGAWKDEGVG